MKVVFNSWNRGYYELCSESATLSQLDGFNKTRYGRRKNQAGLLEQASREAHDGRRVYFATVYDGQRPHCFLECNQGYFYVGFLDEELRVCLDYVFDELSPGRLFLKEVSFFEFDPGTGQVIKRTDHKFGMDGSLKIITYGNHGQDILTAQAPLPQAITDRLWTDYPGFGEYGELIKADRIPEEVFAK